MNDFYAYSVQNFKVSELALWNEYTVSLSLVTIKKISIFLFNASAESINCSLLKSYENILLFDLQKKTSSNTLKIYRIIYRKKLSAIIYRLPTSLQEIEIYYRYRPGLF